MADVVMSDEHPASREPLADEEQAPPREVGAAVLLCFCLMLDIGCEDGSDVEVIYKYCNI